MIEQAKENDMYDDFPVGGDPLDIPDKSTDFDVEAILEA